ncbi:MAG: PA2169 family four-helix-bundle protein [Bradymonadaceae bacterium]|nr:PA2169 family four-helix-bundle protein [Lujinxingiaceae bacterium]
MAVSNKDVVKTLADLRETNIDLQKIYKTASDKVADAHVKSKFTEFSEKYSRFATEIERELNTLGERPDKSGSFVGTLHRTFTEIRSAFSKNDVDAMVDECIRAEKMAIDNYDDALKLDLPANLQSLLSQQYGDLKQTKQMLENYKRTKSF